jgi:hypothetical protein
VLEPKILKIDEVIRNEHTYLQADDLCYYFGDYYPRQGYGHNPMNQLIWNVHEITSATSCFNHVLHFDIKTLYPFPLHCVNRYATIYT